MIAEKIAGSLDSINETADHIEAGTSDVETRLERQVECLQDAVARIKEQSDDIDIGDVAAKLTEAMGSATGADAISSSVQIIGID